MNKKKKNLRVLRSKAIDLSFGFTSSDENSDDDNHNVSKPKERENRLGIFKNRYRSKLRLRPSIVEKCPVELACSTPICSAKNVFEKSMPLSPIETATGPIASRTRNHQKNSVQLQVISSTTNRSVNSSEILQDNSQLQNESNLNKSAISKKSRLNSVLAEPLDNTLKDFEKSETRAENKSNKPVRNNVSDESLNNTVEDFEKLETRANNVSVQAKNKAHNVSVQASFNNTANIPPRTTSRRTLSTQVQTSFPFQAKDKAHNVSVQASFNNTANIPPRTTSRRTLSTQVQTSFPSPNTPWRFQDVFTQTVLDKGTQITDSLNAANNSRKLSSEILKSRRSIRDSPEESSPVNHGDDDGGVNLGNAVHSKSNDAQKPNKIKTQQNQTRFSEGMNLTTCVSANANDLEQDIVDKNNKDQNDSTEKTPWLGPLLEEHLISDTSDTYSRMSELEIRHSSNEEVPKVPKNRIAEKRDISQSNSGQNKIQQRRSRQNLDTIQVHSDIKLRDAINEADDTLTNCSVSFTRSAGSHTGKNARHQTSSSEVVDVVDRVLADTLEDTVFETPDVIPSTEPDAEIIPESQYTDDIDLTFTERNISDVQNRQISATKKSVRNKPNKKKNEKDITVALSPFSEVAEPVELRNVSVVLHDVQNSSQSPVKIGEKRRNTNVSQKLADISNRLIERAKKSKSNQTNNLQENDSKKKNPRSTKAQKNLQPQLCKRNDAIADGKESLGNMDDASDSEGPRRSKRVRKEKQVYHFAVIVTARKADVDFAHLNSAYRNNDSDHISVSQHTSIRKEATINRQNQKASSVDKENDIFKKPSKAPKTKNTRKEESATKPIASTSGSAENENDKPTRATTKAKRKRKENPKVNNAQPSEKIVINENLGPDERLLEISNNVMTDDTSAPNLSNTVHSMTREKNNKANSTLDVKTSKKLQVNSAPAEYERHFDMSNNAMNSNTFTCDLSNVRTDDCNQEAQASKFTGEFSNYLERDYFHFPESNKVVKINWCSRPPQMGKTDKTNSIRMRPGLKSTEVGFQSGHLEILPGKCKLKQMTTKFAIIFTVLEGKGIFQVHDSYSFVERSSAVYVPLGTYYYIRNDSSTESLLLYYTQIRTQ